MVEVDQRAIELIAEARAAGAGADLVVRPVHDVVGEQLGAAVEERGEALPAVLGVELVLLLDRDPGKPLALLPDLVVALGLLGFELGELRPCRLPFLSRSGLLLRHLGSFLSRFTRRDSRQRANSSYGSPGVR